MLFRSLPKSWKGFQWDAVGYNSTEPGFLLLCHASLAVDAKLSAFVLPSLDLCWLLLMRLKRAKN